MDRVLAGRYRLRDRLGAGGMSVVWRAHDDVLDREVAVKVLATEKAADPGLAERVRVEARAAARLRHPHVVEVHDYGQTEDDLPYVVMELVDGRSLADLLARGALPWRSAALIGAQVATALAAAHACGVVHRDVKPSNVMVTSAGVKLVDFGISATVGEADRIGGEVLGTPAYLAPERLRGGPVRPATDVYALGLLLYLMLAGRLPWDASTTTQMLRAHRYLQPAVLPPVPGLSAELADLCHRCLAKDPADRPSADEAARLLADAAGLPPATALLVNVDRAPAEVAGTTVIVATVRRHRRPLLAAAAVTALVMVASVLWFGARPDDQGVAMAAAPAEAAAEPASPQCTVGYAIRSTVNGRLSTALTITTTGPDAARDWQLTFLLPDGQRLVRGWAGGSWAQEGQSVQVSGTGLAAGGQVSTGFDATYRVAAKLPAQFRLNGAVCQAQMSVSGSTVLPTPATTSKSAANVRTVHAAPAVASGGGSNANGKTKAKTKGNGKAKAKGNGKAKGKDK
jgi:serine/threonine-protein kinase